LARLRGHALILELDRNRNQSPVAHTALGNDTPGEVPHIARRTFQTVGTGSQGYPAAAQPSCCRAAPGAAADKGLRGAWRRVERDCARLRHEQAGDRVVVAAGAAQAPDIPVVDQFAVHRREEDRVNQFTEMGLEPSCVPSSSWPIRREYPATSAARMAARRRVEAMAGAGLPVRGDEFS